MNNWIQLSIEVPDDARDLAVLIEDFMACGCPSVQEEDRPRRLVSYLSDTDGVDDIVRLLCRRLEHHGAPGLKQEVVADFDWESAWRDHFKSRRVGSHFLIVPSWEVPHPAPGDHVIHLDPGQAFGTGDHPTTRLSLCLLEKVPVYGAKVGDIGCGTGVLAIGASLLGAHEVLASDLDPLSVEIANQNFERNSVPIKAACVPGFAGIGAQVDIAVSNIISATLIRLAPDAWAAIKKGGYWIVSGVIETNWPDVKHAAESSGFTLVEEVREDEWIGATFLR